MKGLQLNAKSIFGALVSLFLLFVMVYVISRAWRSGREGRLLGYRMGGDEGEESNFVVCDCGDGAATICETGGCKACCKGKIRRTGVPTARLTGTSPRPRVPYVGGTPSRTAGGKSAPKPTARIATAPLWIE